MSMQRECLIYKAVNGKWYMALGNREHSGLDDATTYGPFTSEEACLGELEYHSNPGSYSTDSNGTISAPRVATPPSRRRFGY